MTKLICTEHRHKSSNPGYLYLPQGWQDPLLWFRWEEKHKINRIECNTLTRLYLFNTPENIGIGVQNLKNMLYVPYRVKYLPESSVLIWKACEGNMYSISHIGQYISSSDRVWTDMNNKPVIATPTTLEELEIYRTFLWPN